MNKFFSKINKVNKNFSQVLTGLNSVKSDFEDLKTLLGKSNNELFSKAPTKLRNIMAVFSTIKDNVTDSAVEASEFESSTEGDKCKRKSRIASKQFDNVMKNFDELSAELSNANELATDIKESFGNGIPENITSEVVDTNNDTTKTPIASGTTVTSTDNTEVPAAEPQQKEAMSFSKIGFFKDKINKINVSFSELVDNATSAVDSVVDIADTTEDDKPAVVSDDEEVKTSADNLEEATDVIEKKVDELPEGSMKSFAKAELAKIRKMKVTNFAEVEEKTAALEEVASKINDKTCPKCHKDPCICDNDSELIETNEKLEDSIDNFCDTIDNISNDEIKSFAKTELRKIRRMRVTNFAEAEAKTEALEKLGDAIESRTESTNIEESDSKLDEVVDNLGDKIDKIEDTEIKSFAKTELRKIRRMKVTNFSEAEAKTEALEGLDKTIDKKLGIEPETKDLDTEIDKVEDAVDSLEDKVDAIDDAEVKTFCKTKLREIRRMKIKNFEDLDAKNAAIKEVEDKIETPSTDENEEAQVKEGADKLEETVDNLEKKVDELKNEEIKSFAKGIISKIREMKVTNFSELTDKTTAVEDATDQIEDKINLDTAETQITTDNDNTDDTVEFSDEQKAKIAESLKKFSATIEKLEAKCNDETIKSFCKSIRELATPECKNMSEAKAKLAKLKECAEKLAKCGKNLADTTEKPVEQPKENPKPIETTTTTTEEPKENPKPVETQEPPEPKIDDKDAALANFSQKGNGEESYGARLARIGNRSWN